MLQLENTFTNAQRWDLEINFLQVHSDVSLHLYYFGMEDNVRILIRQVEV